ncbi:MAG: PQQ-dependent sugar dehydrogenase, partial [Planctomycetales bacterium]|nr:PQQ-dependent sugar dehydrogenase [Planctomycetales bacterium]
YSPPDFSGQHISRFHLDGDRLDLDSEKLLLKYEEQRRECCHHAGSLEFGPDGHLFIGTGDNTHPGGDSQGYAPIDERPDHEPYDAQKSASNSQSYNGKVLRIKPLPDGSYEIPAGNLFSNPDQGRPEIYVMGCRNPWRISVDAVTGHLYWGDVGPDAGGDGPRGSRGYDEINQARQAGNFGWPYFVGNNRPYHDVDFATGDIGPEFDPAKPENHSPNNSGISLLPPAVPAFIYYPYAESPEFPELGSGGRTACAGPVYYFDQANTFATRFPSHFHRTLFIYEWTRHWIQAVHLDEHYQIQSIERFLPNHSFARPIDMAFGRNGSLYVLEYGDTWGVNQNARLVRIDYIRGNRLPVAQASATNNIGRHPLSVTFSSAGSFDPDQDDVLEYRWTSFRSITESDVANSPTSLEGNVISREANPTITFDQPGVYNVELTVTDSDGAARSSTVPVLVGNSPPKLTFAYPQDGDFFPPTGSIDYQLQITDEEDGSNDEDAVQQFDLEFIASEAVNRTTTNIRLLSGPTQADDANQGPPGLQLMKASDCFNCHAVQQKRVGPPLLEVANKYRHQPDALEKSVERVRLGSTGVWGKVPMIPHAQHTDDEIQEMVRWVYSLEPDSAVIVSPGFVNSVDIGTLEKAISHIQLVANYQDGGSPWAPPIDVSQRVTLRNPKLEAEYADEIHGPMLLDSQAASNAKFVGAINHGHYLRFAALNFAAIESMELHVASAGAGGSIQLRIDAVDGPVVGSTEINVNGHWEEFYSLKEPISPTTGTHDLFVVFAHPTHAGGLMNLDRIDCKLREVDHPQHGE